MHSLAIALKEGGHEVSGSDDQVYDPAKSRLKARNILPDSMGWNPDRITPEVDAVILGMHALADNPELLKAQELKIPCYSFPEFIFEHAKQKQRIVIAGSYGKTTVTSMVMHVLKKAGKKFDYLVGAQVPGFDNPVRLSDDAPIMLMEGDEYLASKTDPRPKFLLYQPHMVVVTGISWDHINVFPTEEEYDLQFELLLQSLEKAADVIVNKEDKKLKKFVKKHIDSNAQYIHEFGTPSYKVKNGVYEIKLAGEKRAVSVIGRHNMANIAAAWNVCQLLSIDINVFLDHISTFIGAQSRLEILSENENRVVIKDFAHAPAKVQATVEAVKERYPRKKLIACAELHTFSSLNKAFLPHYRATLKKADHKIVFINPDAMKKRKMTPFTKDELVQAFGEKTLQFTGTKEELRSMIDSALSGEDVILMMSSSNFGGLELDSLAL